MNNIETTIFSAPPPRFGLITWEEAETAAVNRQEWSRNVAVHGWPKCPVSM